VLSSASASRATTLNFSDRDMPCLHAVAHIIGRIYRKQTYINKELLSRNPTQEDAPLTAAGAHTRCGEHRRQCFCQGPASPSTMSGQPKFGSPVIMMKNSKNVEFVHTIMAIFTGAIAGILGLTGLRGFLLFILAHVVVSGAAALPSVFPPWSVPMHGLSPAPSGLGPHEHAM
jgi:hypothetical protein